MIGVFGTPPYASAWTGDFALNSAIPAVKVGCRMVLVMLVRPSTATVAAPTDNLGKVWTQDVNVTGGTGTFAVNGGTCRMYVWSATAVGGETTVTVPVAGGSGFTSSTFVGTSYCMTWAGAYQLAVTGTGGGDTTDGTGFSTTGSAVDFQPGDVVLWVTGLNADTGISSSVLSASGIGFDTPAGYWDWEAGVNYDGWLRVRSSRVLTGTASVAPTVTGTLHAAKSGASVFLRMRESAPAPMSNPDRFKVLVDWNADSDFSDPLEDVTRDVRPGQSAVSLQYGREAGGDAPTTAGSGGFVLDNRSRKYSTRNTASPLYGSLKPARPVQITRTIGGITYTLFHGHTDETPLNPDRSARTVAPSMVDYLGDFRGQNISTGLHRGIRTGEAIGLVLDHAGWTGGRALDAGATIIPWWWEDSTDALTALDKIVRSEGFPAYLTMGANGEVVFRDRHHRSTRFESVTSQGTWRAAGGAAPVMGRDFTYDDAWQNIVNQASATVDIRTAQQKQVVWSLETPIVMYRNETRTVAFSTTDPFFDAYVDNAGWYNPLFAYSFELTRTSGTSGILTINSGFASSSTWTLTFNEENLRIIANPVTVTSSVIVSAEDAGSVADYGPRSFQGDLPWCGEGDAQAILDQAVADRAEPLPVVESQFLIGRDKKTAAALLARDLSDRVTVVESETVLNDAFHIERIRHDFSGEADHSMSFTLEKVPPGTLTGLLQFDVDGVGFGQGVFGR